MPSLKLNIIANYVGGGWSALMALLFIPIYIRLLGAEAYGLIGVFVVLQSWFTLIELGLAPAMNREMARHQAGVHAPQAIRDLFWSLELVCAGVALVIVAFMFASAQWLAEHWLELGTVSTATATSALLIMGLAIALRFIAATYRSALIGLEHQVWLNSAGAVFATLRNAGVLAVLAWVSASVVAYFWFQVAVSALELLVLARRIRSLLPVAPQPVSFSRTALWEIRYFAGGVSATTVFKLLLTQMDKILLSTLLPLKQFGYYMLAATVAGVFPVLVAPLTNAIYPRLTRMAASADQHSLAAVHHDFAQLVTIVVTPVALTLMLLPEHALFLWTRDVATTDATAGVLSLLICGALLNAFVQPVYCLQLAHGWTAFGVMLNGVSALILAPATFIAIKHLGVYGAPLVWILLNLGYVAVVPYFTHKRLLRGEARKWYVQDLGIPLAVASAAVLPVYLLVPGQATERPVVSVIALGGMMLLAWCSTIGSTRLGRHHVIGAARAYLAR